MDDDAFADLLRNQAGAPAMPSFFNQQSPTLDPFANPFAEDPTSNPFSNAASSSALPNANAFGGSSSLYASGSAEGEDVGGGFGGEGAAAGMLSSSEREENIEARGRVEDVMIAEQAGDGIVEVSPYVQRLEEPGAYGAINTGGQEGKEEMRSATLEESGFGGGAVPDVPVSAFSGGFQDDSIPYQTPYNAAPPIATFSDPYDEAQTPFNGSSGYDQQQSGYAAYTSSPPTYPSAYSPRQQPSSFASPTSPSRASRAAIPSSLLAPPEDMLGSTPSDSLKAAFVKKSSSGPLAIAEETNGKDGANGVTGDKVKASPAVAAPTAEPEKKPYVFKPGGSIKRRKGEGIRQSNHTRTPSALASAPPISAPAAQSTPPPVPEKDTPTSVSQPIAPATNVTAEVGEAQGSTPTAQVVSSQLAEQILTAANPQKASQAVAEQISSGAQAAEGARTEEVKADTIREVAEVAKDIPLPDSEPGTPRAGTPVPQIPTPTPESSIFPSQAQNSMERRQSLAPPQTAQPNSSSSSNFDRVAVSPLTSTPTSARTDTAHHFQALSIGGSSPAMPSAESNGSMGNGTLQSGTSSSQGRQTSWGRAYDEPPSPEQASSSRMQRSQAPSPSPQGWTTEVPHAEIVQSATPTSASSGQGGGGWDSPGFGVQTVSGSQGEDVSAEAWGGGGYTSPQRAVPEIDDVPYRSAMPRSASTASVKEGGRTRLMDQPMFTITLSDPTKVGDPIRGHIVYTVTTRTTSPHYRRAECSVLRRFSDFLWLFEAVSANNPGVIVPPVPDKHAFGRFEEQFVETRRAALEGSLRKMANHPVLALDQDLRLFLESDSFALEIKHRRQEMTQEKQGLLAGLTGPKFSETDDWFDHRKTFLDALEIQLKSLTKSIEASSKHRLDLAVLIDRLADSVAQLAESDLAVDLSAALQRLSGLNKKEKEMLETQAKMDVIHLMNCAEEYIRLIGSVRLAFASRIKSYFTWQNVEADSRRLKQQHEKLRRANKIPQDRIQSALAEISDADRRSIDAHSDFDAVTRLVKIEFARFEAERIHDFKTMLERYLEGMVERQRDFINAWEGYHAILARMHQSSLARPGANA